jgi:CYTH domain-containing protein
MKNNSSVPLEIERKFLITYPSLSWLEEQPGARKAELEQTYLTSDGSCSRRVRLWREGAELHCYRSVKRAVSDMTRIEEEDEISAEEYRRLLAEADPERRPVRKTRWCLPYVGHVLEIDLFPFWSTQAVLECELESEDEAFSLPPELTVLREVTGDRRYLNSVLAGMSGDELQALVIPSESPDSAAEES